jgi:FMN phosphatase YigB (HAD superfamily)
MRIFIDFDDTLFYTKKFRQDLTQLFLSHGIPQKDFETSYKTITGKNDGCKIHYSPEKQIQLLQKNILFDSEKLEKDLKIFLEKLASYVFKDSYVFLGNFKKSALFLVTYGDTKIQKAKVRGAGLTRYFHKIIIANGTKSEGILKFISNDNARDEGIYFIDDRTEYIFEIKNTFPKVVTFLMKRKAGRYNDVADRYCDFTVKNLSQALRIIKKLEQKII